MRKPFSLATLSVVLAGGTLLLPGVVFAQRDIITPVADQVLVLFNVLTTIVFIASVVAFGWGIVSFIMSANDPAAVQKSKGFLFWGVVGMAIGATLFGIITFFQTYVGVRGGRLLITPPEVIQGGGGPTGGGAVGGGGTGGTVNQPPPPPPPPGTTTPFTP